MNKIYTQNNQDLKLLFATGCSGSGKTHISELIKNILQKKGIHSCKIPLDPYYDKWKVSDMLKFNAENVDFEKDSLFRINALCNTIKQIKYGYKKDVSLLQYKYHNGSHAPGSGEKVDLNSNVIIVEGIFAIDAMQKLLKDGLIHNKDILGVVNIQREENACKAGRVKRRREGSEEAAKNEQEHLDKGYWAKVMNGYKGILNKIETIKNNKTADVFEIDNNANDNDNNKDGNDLYGQINKVVEKMCNKHFPKDHSSSKKKDDNYSRLKTTNQEYGIFPKDHSSSNTKVNNHNHWQTSYQADFSKKSL